MLALKPKMELKQLKTQGFINNSGLLSTNEQKNIVLSCFFTDKHYICYHKYPSVN